MTNKKNSIPVPGMPVLPIDEQNKANCQNKADNAQKGCGKADTKGSAKNKAAQQGQEYTD